MSQPSSSPTARGALHHRKGGTARSLVAGVGLKEVVQLDALVHHTLYLPLPQRLRKAYTAGVPSSTRGSHSCAAACSR